MSKNEHYNNGCVRNHYFYICTNKFLNLIFFDNSRKRTYKIKTHMITVTFDFQNGPLFFHQNIWRKSKYRKFAIPLSPFGTGAQLATLSSGCALSPQPQNLLNFEKS